MSEILEALQIAATDLRSCYRQDGIMTGSRGVYWSWDSFFASFGALALGDFDMAKRNLQLYLSYQTKDGNIPKRIANPLYPLKYIGLPVNEDASFQKPSFQSPYFTGISISQCPTLVLAFAEYISASNDLIFLKQNIKKLELLFEFLQNHTYKSGLLREDIGGGWAESVLKRGAISYTNVCYVEALKRMASLERILGNDDKTIFFQEKSEIIREACNNTLWDESQGGFYSDWRGISRHHHFSADGNLLAVWWNIADGEKAEKIDEQLDYLLEKYDIPIPLTSDKYNFWRIFFANRFGGLKDYHVAFSWIWLGAVSAIVKHKLGQKKSAVKILERIAKQILKDKNVCEIYFNKKPVNVTFYKCERPWAWSAGLFIFACSHLGIKLDRKEPI